MRPVNLFLTKDGVLKLGYYGLTTQAECYSIKETDCDGIRSFGPEVFKGEYEMKSDVWSFGIALIEMMGITPYVAYENNCLPSMSRYYKYPFNEYDMEASDILIVFLQNCFECVHARLDVNELLNVSVIRWRMMSSIHL